MALVTLNAAGGSDFRVSKLVSDQPGTVTRDRALVNAWGLAAEGVGPWWTANEASDTSTLYSGAGRKQLLTVSVAGGPTGIVFNGGHGFVISGGGRSDPARFIYACEDGKLRAWTPTVPHGWSTQSEVTVDLGGEAAVFRGLAIAGNRLYATDFHNAKVDVFDAHWHRISGGFVDRAIPSWYAPFGIRALGSRVFVTYVYRAPVDGNDAPTGGYVDEFTLAGRLVAHVAAKGVLNAPWGLARAPASFGKFGGDLLVGNFGDGRINAFRQVEGAWRHDGALPVVVNGLWAIAFGNGGAAGPKDTLFFTSGPHDWRGATELGVHGLLGSVSA